MKKFAALFLTFAAVFCMVFSVTGCGASDEDKLKAYVGSSQGQEAMNELEEQMADNDVFDFGYEVVGTSIVINLTLKEQMDSSLTDSLSSNLDTSVSTIGGTMTQACSMMEEESGVENITVKFNVFNNDNTELWSHTFE